MIPLALSFLTGGLGRVWSFLRSLSPVVLLIVALALFGGIQTWRVGRVSGQLDRAIAAGTKLIADTKTATLRNVAQQTGRLIAEANTRAQISKDSANEANARNVALSADYDGLWSKYRRLSATGKAPTVPDRASKFDATSCGDKLFGISPETAFALMFNADKNAGQLIDLQNWVRKQAAVDPNVDAPTP